MCDDNDYFNKSILYEINIKAYIQFRFTTGSRMIPVYMIYLNQLEMIS